MDTTLPRVAAKQSAPALLQLEQAFANFLVHARSHSRISDGGVTEAYVRPQRGSTNILRRSTLTAFDAAATCCRQKNAISEVPKQERMRPFRRYSFEEQCTELRLNFQSFWTGASGGAHSKDFCRVYPRGRGDIHHCAFFYFFFFFYRKIMKEKKKKVFFFSFFFSSLFYESNPEIETKPISAEIKVLI